MADKEKAKSEKETKKKERKVEARSAAFPDLNNEKKDEISRQKNNLEMLFDVPLRISAELGRTSMSIQEILRLVPGSVVELDKLAGEPVDLLVNGKLVAKGEVVVTEENFGVRITEIIGQEARIRNLQ